MSSTKGDGEPNERLCDEALRSRATTKSTGPFFMGDVNSDRSKGSSSAVLADEDCAAAEERGRCDDTGRESIGPRPASGSLASPKTSRSEAKNWRYASVLRHWRRTKGPFRTELNSAAPLDSASRALVSASDSPFTTAVTVLPSPSSCAFAWSAEHRLGCKRAPVSPLHSALCVKINNENIFYYVT